jgi:transcription initiation factor TFIIIB Brf1 subunit/transcription initiation factor TFIIB
MDADMWVDRYARELGLEPPTEAQREAILQLASVAAHASERRAAPVACWLAASAGRDLDEAIAIARALDAGPADGATS